MHRAQNSYNLNIRVDKRIFIKNFKNYQLLFWNERCEHYSAIVEKLKKVSQALNSLKDWNFHIKNLNKIDKILSEQMKSN